MNLDELVDSIRDDKLRENLLVWVLEWKQNEKDVLKLENSINRWFGHIWFSAKEDSDRFYRDFQGFKQVAIDCIGGLTLNERLYWFGLMDAWERGDEATQQRLRNKLHAKL